MWVNEIQRNFSYVTFFLFRSTKASLIARYIIPQSSHVNKRFLPLVRLFAKHSQATRDAIVPVHTRSDWAGAQFLMKSTTREDEKKIWRDSWKPKDQRCKKTNKRTNKQTNKQKRACRPSCELFKTIQSTNEKVSFGVIRQKIFEMLTFVMILSRMHVRISLSVRIFEISRLRTRVLRFTSSLHTESRVI